MRRELIWALAACAALALGAAGAQSYARFAAPYYEAVTRLIALGHPWKILTVEVQPGEVSPGSALTLTAEVREHALDAQPAASVASHVNVGEVVQTPLIFWTLLLLWPAASGRQRLSHLLVGLPVFLTLEAVTTAVQLMHPLPGALLGADDPPTLLELWSRFLEAGGHFALAVCALLVTIALARGRYQRRSAAVASGLPGAGGLVRGFLARQEARHEDAPLVQQVHRHGE